MSKLDGGPAFPTDIYDTKKGNYLGMTLRDYFAAKAMQAELISSGGDYAPEAATTLAEAARRAGRSVARQIAHNAYKIADAMLKAREK